MLILIRKLKVSFLVGKIMDISANLIKYLFLNSSIEWINYLNKQTKNNIVSMLLS